MIGTIPNKKHKKRKKSGVYPLNNNTEKSQKKKFTLPKLKKIHIPYRKIGLSFGIVVFLFIVVFGFYQGYIYLYTSPRFNISKVTITHIKHLNDAEIIKLAGINPNTNIFKLKSEEVTRHLIAHPWIKEVKVWKELPNIIHIEIKEQKADAAVKFENECNNNTCEQYDTFYLVNSDGKIFKKAKPNEMKEIIIFSGLKKSWFRQNRTGFEYLLKRNLAIYKTYKQHSNLPQLSEIYSTYNSIVLILKDSAVSVHLSTKQYKKSITVFQKFLSGFNMNLKEVSDIFTDNDENISRVVVLPIKKPVPPEEQSPNKTKKS